uniref:Cytochrome b5 heme-binding domain-containing protein n=1 Tax=viral metagenome TaxID=1070528 RepID=A0A6C0IYM7_9ZZZZ
MIYDTIIIGAGIAGLYIANRLDVKKTLIIERRYKSGGRIKTDKELNLDTGAYRISSSHKKILQLIDNLGLKDKLKDFNPRCKYIGTKQKKLPGNEIRELYKKLKDDKDIRNLSFYNLAQKVLDGESVRDIVDRTGYNNGACVKQAYHYFKPFSKSKRAKYFYMKDGLEQITKKLEDGLNIKFKTSFQDYDYDGKEFTVFTNNGIFNCKKLILSYSVDEDFLGLPGYTTKNKYIRIFIKFKTKWFKNIQKIITPGPFRQIINIENEYLQIYSDYKYAELLNKLLWNGELEDFLNLELRKLFPEMTKIVKFKAFFWNSGTYYWKLGLNSEKLYKKMLQPFRYPLYIAGERYSLTQGWMEGALETAYDVLEKIEKKGHVGGGKSYQMQEVKKHDKADDAWIVIEDKVYDITDWVPIHPGGGVILKKLGQDATTTFMSVHPDPDFIKENLLKKFYIGTLK